MRRMIKTIFISLSCTLLLTGCLKEDDLYKSYSNIDIDSVSIDNSDTYNQLTDKQYLFSATCLEYNMMVPYVQGGRSDNSLKKYLKGIMTVDLEVDQIQGVDSEGYVKWLYKKIFKKDIIDGALNNYLKQCIKISGVSELQIGDICLTNDNVIQYGVVAYIAEDGKVIVSLCDSRPSEKFVTGSVRLAYIQSQQNSYYGDSLPVDFTMFYRPNVKWES